MQVHGFLRYYFHCTAINGSAMEKNVSAPATIF